MSKKKAKKIESQSSVVSSFDPKMIVLFGALAIFVVVLAVQLWNPVTPSTQTSTKLSDYSGNKVKLDFYVMSQCPYGTQVEDAVAPVLKELGDAVDFNVNFIANDLGGGKFQSLHGENEVQGDLVQICADKYNPDQFVDMVTCMNADARSIPGNWEACAKKFNMDTTSIKKCFGGDEGKQLLSASIDKSKAVNAQGSPTMLINNQPYDGGRDSLSFKRALCAQLSGHEACAEIPVCATDADCVAKPDKEVVCNNPNTKSATCEYIDPIKVDVVVLSDQKCPSCDVSSLLTTTKSLFKGAQVKTVDISSAEGKALADANGISVLPVIFFGKSMEQTSAWKANPNLASAFESATLGYRLRDAVTQASWFIDEEKRQQFYADIGVKLGDNKPQIDFFVMSFCPYGNQAEELLKPVYDQLKGKVDFNPHYIYYSNYQGGGAQYCLDADSKFCSMHGVQEARQDIREDCVKEMKGMDGWFDFALAINKQCTAQNADTCWTGVAQGLGIDVDAIKSCEKEKVMTYANKDFILSDKMGASGSPTIVIDGVKYGGSRSAQGFLAGLCAAFDKKPAECDNVVAEPQAASAPAAQGGCGV